MEFIEQISEEEHDQFVSCHPLCNLLQSSNWSKIKHHWGHALVGVRKDRELIASSLVLIKRLPAGFTMLYIPRGPILDYQNEDLVKFYFEHLRRFAKKHRCIFIKFDPGIVIRETSTVDQITDLHGEATEILKHLQDAHAIHKGFTTYIKETIQPRFSMGLYATEQLDAHVPRATLRSKHVAIRKHVSVVRAGIQGLDQFAKLMQMTEARKHVQLRDKAYFQTLMETYGDDADLFLASVDLAEYEQELHDRMQAIQEALAKEETGHKQRKRLMQEYQQLEQELASLEPLRTSYGKQAIIAGGLMVGYGTAVEMLYAGMNDDFRTYRPQYLTYMEQFAYAFAQGYTYVSMGGVEGTLKDGLSTYKLNFNPVIKEMIGEFDLPVNPILYRCFMLAYRLYKK